MTAQVSKKFEIISGSEDDLGNMTVALYGEDHTLGNALREQISNNPHVELCAYSIPHPSENKIHIRIQTDGSITALDALSQGLQELADISVHVGSLMKKEIEGGNFNISQKAEW